MKVLQFVLLIFCCSIFTVNTTTAQTKAEKAFNKALKTSILVFDKDKIFDTSETYAVNLPKKVLKRAIKLPVELKTPFTMKGDGFCVQVGCRAAKGGDCNTDCHLMWRDANRDGAIQPDQELRCMCKNGGKCGMAAKKAECE
ncbi:MAG: hypothetical protein AB8G15_17765 [Saprospiraceae bacterium]